ncbi:hypothetical protein FF38_01334 [Lucilia cuprina]|uniref:DUF4371 domain-containing protein n=1 Tax=Lucilia cuprina TaxID=7375 RepID=A0A0L0BVS7_LUCCU|nr:hypothetical protein FF38_01334 [Lucilia cuprina]
MRHRVPNNLDEIVSDVWSSEVDDESDSDEDPKLSGLVAHLTTKKHNNAIAPFNVGQETKVNFNPISSHKDTKRACLQNAIYAACHTSINSVDHLTLLQKKTFCDSAIAKDLQMADIGDSVFSLLIDESTDVSVKKQLGIVVRYYSESSRCLGTDNANAMVGANEGVIAQLKKKNSNIILVPCVCHSVQLAVTNASKFAVKRIVDQWFELKAHLSELYTDYNLAYLLFLKPVLAEVQKKPISQNNRSLDLEIMKFTILLTPATLQEEAVQ